MKLFPVSSFRNIKLCKHGSGINLSHGKFYFCVFRFISKIFCEPPSTDILVNGALGLISLLSVGRSEIFFTRIALTVRNASRFSY